MPDQTVLDVASRSNLDTVLEIDLSRDEDSVTTVANLASKDGLVTLAGINSSEAEQKAGRNEHLRTFEITYPPKTKRQDTEQDKQVAGAEGSITFAGKAALFKPATGPRPETYQRLLRLSPAHKKASGNKRIGAVATGLANQSEIVVFDATKTPPSPTEIVTRIAIRGNAEAADLDIIEPQENTFSVSWCTDYDVYEQTINYDFATQKLDLAPPNPRKIHSVPLREDSAKPPRPKYRSLRFLTDEDILLLTNLPNKSGADLQILHLYPSGPAAVLFHKVLPSRVKQAVALDVCVLDADQHGNRQIVVAVAGQDISICIYTLDYNGTSQTFSSFKSFTTLRDVHPLQMTSLRFSTFHSPHRPSAPSPSDLDKGERKPGVPVPSHPGPQYIKLCSASMGNTVVVETMALTPLNPSDSKSRYVLAHPSDAKRLQTAYMVLASFIVLVSAVLLQSLFFPDSSPLTSLLPIPSAARNLFAHPASIADSIGRGGRDQLSSASAAISDTLVPAAVSAIPATGKRLADLLHLHLPSSSSDADAQGKALIIRDAPSSTELSIDVIQDKAAYLNQDALARHWHELEEFEKEAWRKRLSDAGHWTVEEGEKVLKGILFSSWAGLVGRVAGEAIREL